MEHYSAITRKEVLTEATTWMDPEDTVLSATAVTKGQIVYDCIPTGHPE